MYALRDLLGAPLITIPFVDDACPNSRIWLCQNYHPACCFHDCGCWAQGGLCSSPGHQECTPVHGPEDVLFASAPCTLYSAANGQRRERLLLPDREPAAWPVEAISDHLDQRTPTVYLGEQVATVLDPFPKNLSNDETQKQFIATYKCCLLYTSPSPRDGLLSRMPSSA